MNKLLYRGLKKLAYRKDKLKRTLIKIIPLLFLALLVNCSLLKKPKKTVLQNEGGRLSLTASANADTLAPDQLEKLRIYMTLKNHYPFTVRSLKYLTFCTMNVFKDGVFFYTMENNFNERRYTLNPGWYETFPADSATVMMFYVDIKKVCANKQIPPQGRYTFQGVYENRYVADDEKFPVWVGRLKSNKKAVIVK